MYPYRLTIFAIENPLVGEIQPIVDLRPKDKGYRPSPICVVRGISPYNAFMANPPRSARTAVRPPLAAAESAYGTLPPLVPDIITARQRPAATGSGSSAPEPQFEPALDPLDDLSIIEARHPDIARAITLLWGYPEMNEYFERIWVADGFHAPIDPDAMSELMLLGRLHQAITPQRPGRSMASILSNNRWQQTSSGPAPDPWREVPRRR